MTVSILVLAGFVTGFDTKYVSLKIFRNTVLLCLQYRQRAIQRETRTGACFVSLNQVVVLLSVSDLEMSDICCDCFSVVVVIVVIFTRARVLLALLSLRKNGGLLVVYCYCYKFGKFMDLLAPSFTRV